VQGLKVVYLLPRMSLKNTQMIGVRKKILGQVDGLQAHGLEVSVMDEAREPYDDGCSGVDIARAQRPSGAFDKRISKWLDAFRGKSQTVIQLLTRVRGAAPAVVYVRHTATTPGLILFYFLLRTFGRAKRIYLEVPTWPYKDELHGYYSDRFLSPLIRLFVDRVITFSEISSIFGLPTIKITNGVSSSATPLMPVPHQSNPFKIVCVAHMHTWSGIDRLLSGVAAYYKGHEFVIPIDLHIAGDGDMLKAWKRLAADLNLESVVTFHGNCSGEKLESVFIGAHLAIGNLANHRRQLAENADLKNREYCMRGIPFVVASADNAFPADFPYITKAESNDSALDLAACIRFQQLLAQKFPTYNHDMRFFAIKKFEWTNAMLPVIEDIRSFGYGH